MYQRPVSVTVVGWILSVWGAIGAYRGLHFMAASDNPDFQKAVEGQWLPASDQIALGVVSAVVTFIAGVTVLRGEGWCRFLYAGWCVILLILSVLNDPTDWLLIPEMLFRASLIVILFLPKANEYFSIN